MITITRVNNLNLMSSRSHIVNSYNSSTVNYSSIVCIVSDFNGYITSSIITNNNHHSTITIINNTRFCICFCLLHSHIWNCMTSRVISISKIFNGNSVVSTRYVLSSYNSFSIINLSSVIFTTNTDCDIAGSTFRNFNSDYNIFAFLSLINSHINWSIILRSSNISSYSSISMITVTRVNNLNHMISRSHISNINNSSTINHSSIELLITNFNSHITCSVITDNYHYCTITIINYCWSHISFDIDVKLSNTIICRVIIVTSILGNYCFSSTGQVTDRNNCFTLINWAWISNSINCYINVPSSICRNFNMDNSCTIIGNVSYIDFNFGIVFWNCYCWINCYTSVVSISGIYYCNILSSRSYVFKIDDCTAVCNIYNHACSVFKYYSYVSSCVFR